jgi:hypothetical protein
MEIQTNVVPPTKKNQHRRYAVLIETLKVNSGWVAVSIRDVCGHSIAEKQSAVHGTCRRAGIKIETQTTATQIFIRRLEAVEVHDAH